MEHPKRDGEDSNSPYTHPVFRGASHTPMIWGIPTTIFFVTFMCVAFVAMQFGLWIWATLLVILPTLRAITRSDENAFRIMWLAFKTRWSNRNKAFWQGSSYTPTHYDRRRPWQQKK